MKSTTSTSGTCFKRFFTQDYGGATREASNHSIHYRRFANAAAVVNGGSGSATEVAHLPGGHTYTGLLGRPVANPLTITSTDGYVLLRSNGRR